MYKLSAFGAAIATAVFNDKIINARGLNTISIICIGVGCLPFLSFLIDMKALEVAMHVKLISRHLQENFTDVAEIEKWEKGLWTKADSRFRTKLTIGSAFISSLLICALSTGIVYILKPAWTIYIIGACVLPLLVILLVAGKKFFELLGVKKISTGKQSRPRQDAGK